MSAYIIEGDTPGRLCADTRGKNSVLPILAACLLAPGECVIHNCPELSDVAASWTSSGTWAAGRSGRGGRRGGGRLRPPRAGTCPTR